VKDRRNNRFFRALELVADRDTRAPFPRSRGLAARIRSQAMAAGMVCYPGAGTADGVDGGHVLLAPPFIVSDAELDLIVERLGHALEAALPGTGR